MLGLIETVEVLKRTHVAPPVPDGAFEMILWENIGYLIDDSRRRDLFDTFLEKVGATPAAISAASDALLLSIAERGGMRPDVRVQRWRTIADLILATPDGDLDRELRRLSPAKARLLLKKFPVIGDPGVDKILLFSGLAIHPCLESNGLRVMARLGFSPEHPSYTASYKAAVQVIVDQGRPDREWLVNAYELLRAHGKLICKRGRPECTVCPLNQRCAQISTIHL